MRQPDRLSERLAAEVADTMFALSTPSRVQILGCLLAGPQTVTALVEMLGMEQSAVSHQLRVLREHKLVTVERDGRNRLYALYDDDVVGLLDGALRHVERRSPTGHRLASRLKRSSA
jgi:DNA-binding transcriptional ArsR family regulator